MTHDFDQVDALFNETIALPPDQRREFLKQRAGDDSSLLEEVWALVEHHESPHGVFDVDAAHAVSRVVAFTGTAVMPERIGRYRIVRLLDRGGMGVVYLAEQDEPRRQVALKVMQSSLVTPGRSRRFAQEVQLLARLRHPGIAQIYDAGSHEVGEGPRPWFAMEYVDGLPITEFARTRTISIEDRLRLMILVCDAVQHAHQRGVIHRDLKPGNIFVPDRNEARSDDSTFMMEFRTHARPKVLDFGIARATDREIGQSTMHTQTGQLLGTLPYMSPEQVSGEMLEVDVRSDVYALGVILYELLTARLPYDVKDRPLPTVARTIAEESPAPISSIDRSLRGDLEQIVSKALAKEKRDRYQSASDLADDLLRFLNDEPISARPPSLWYQCRKFARRNRTLVGGALVLAVILLSSSIVSTALFLRADRESRARAAQVIETQWQAYIANIAAAHSAVREGRAADARRYLGLAPADLRGWEWAYLDGLLNRSSVVFSDSDISVPDAIFSHDGASVITCDDDDRLNRYDARTGSLIAFHEKAHDHWITELAFHPVRNIVASASIDRTVGIFDAETLELIARSDPLPAPLRSLAWSSDGEVLYCGGTDGALLLVNSRGEAIDSPFAGHANVIEGMALTDDGRMLATCSGDRSTRLWDTTTGAELARFDSDSGIYDVTLSRDGRKVACCMVDGFVSVFDTQTHERIAHWQADVDRVLSIAFSPDASILATGAHSSRVRLWETRAWRMVIELLGHSEPVRSLEYDMSGRYLLSSSNDHTARSWDLSAIGVDVVHEHNAWVYDVQASDDGTRAATSTGHAPVPDGAVRLFDLATGALLDQLDSDRALETLILHLTGVNDLATIVTHFGDRLRIWRPDSSSLVELERSGRSHASAAFGDGQYVVVTDSDYAIVRVIDLARNEVAAVLDARGEFEMRTGLTDVVVSPDGDRIFTVAPEADSVLAWDWPNRALEAVHVVDDIPDEPGEHALAISRDGRTLALAMNGRADLFDATSWRRLASLSFTSTAAALRFSPDDTRLFAGCYDGALRIWDVPTGRLVGTLYVHPSNILDLDLSADGSVIVTGSADTTMRVLRAQD